MTRPPDPVDPEQLTAAFVLILEETSTRAPEVHHSLQEGGTIWEAIMRRFEVDPHMTSALFRRALALSNFFADVANRAQFDIDDSLPRREIWRAAATAPVHRKIVDDLAWDFFEPAEFAAWLRPITEADALRVAAVLFDQHGRAACLAAARVADEFLEEGDIDGSKVWLRIGAAVEELTRGPRRGEPIN